MTNDQRDKTNQTIHEARGLCRHEWTYQSNGDDTARYYNPCPKCQQRYNFVEDCLPDYTSDWSAWGAALEWAQGEEWWEGFVSNSIYCIIQTLGDKIVLFDVYSTTQVIAKIIANPLKGSSALAEFIDKHPEYFKKEVKK